jgi:hypothetical protein
MLGRHVYRVSPAAKGEWLVAKEGEAQPRGTRPSRDAAVKYACDLAAADEPSKVSVEDGQGKLADERIFGVDPGEVLQE